MAATATKASSKSTTKHTAGDSAAASLELLELIEPFGWSIDPDVDQLPADVVEWLLKPDGATPENLLRCVSIPSSRFMPPFRNTNDAKAAAYVCLQTMLDFESVMVPDRAASFLKVRCQSGVNTPFGSVFTDKGLGFQVWFGRKAGQVASLNGDEGMLAMNRLFGHGGHHVPRDDREVTPSEQPAPTGSRKKMVATKEVVGLSENDKATLRMVRLSNMQPAKENHRKTFDKAALTELADSIKAHGVLQPLLLRPLNDIRPAEFFVIVAGERRYRAALQAGLKEVPAQIVEREGVSESLAMLEENIRRVDLNPIERAQAIRRLMDEHSLSQKEVGQMVGCGQGQISNELRLLNLPESLQAMVAAGTIAPTLIRVVLPWSDVPTVMKAVAAKFKTRIDDKETLDVSIVESIVDDSVNKASRSMDDRSKDPVSEWMKPSKDLRYFGKVDPEKLKALDVRKVKHWGAEEERAFNIPLFHELNREPLKKRMEKYNELQRKKGKPAKAKSDDKTDKLFEGGDYTMRRLIGESLNPLLADALEKCRDKGKARAVCLTLMCAAEYIAEPLVGKNIGDDDFVPLLLELFTAADCDKQLRDKLVAELRRDFHLEPRESIELAKALGVDLLQLWKPTDELVQTLTDHGRELLAAAAGSVPEFLLPFFGIEPKKPAKAKKAKAA
jgi:ParB family transcriptional regulator, chromosome partitioning protein